MNRIAKQPGLIIGAVGIAGCGKSSTFQALHRLLPDSILYCEPEEKDWPTVIRQRDMVGDFSYVMTGFRSLWVPNFYMADAARAAGKVVLLDHCIAKVLWNMLGREETAWLMQPTDPYCQVAKELAQLDMEELPDPDVLVVFEPEFTAWVSWVKSRNRAIDQKRDYTGTYQANRYIQEAATVLAQQRGITVIPMVSKKSTPVAQAQWLYQTLIEKAILPNSLCNP